jgi:hypothetical protein
MDKRFGVSLTLLRFAAACATLTGTVAIADEHVTAHGYWHCWDSSVQPGGQVVPLEGARVELVDSDCRGSEICDDVMGTSHVQADGSYWVEGSGGDPGIWWTEPDVYVRVVFTDDEGVREADDIDITRSASTPQHDHDNVKGDIDFGGMVTGLGVDIGDGNKCGVWLAARRAYRAYIQTVGSAPPAGYYDITYYSALYGISPWTDRDTTHWPTHFPLNPFFPNPPSRTYAIDHEFGHTLRHAADGDRNHFNWDSTRFRYGREHYYCESGVLEERDEDREGAAFNEGWAEYWAGLSEPCNNPLNFQVEGDIAAALSLLATCPGVGRAGLMRVLINNSYAIHSYGEFRSKYNAMYPTCVVDTDVVSAHAAQIVKRPDITRLASQVSSSALGERSRLLDLEMSRVNTQGAGQTCKSDKDCSAAADRLIHLAMLKAAMTLTDFEKKQLTQSKADGANACRDCELQRRRHDRFVAVRDAYAAAFEASLSSIDKLPGNEATRVAAAELRRKQERFLFAARSGHLMQSDSLLDDAILGERVARQETLSRRDESRAE